MRWIALFAGALLGIGCTEAARTAPAKPAVSIFSCRPDPQALAELDWSVVHEGHQPWRLDPKWVADVEARSRLKDIEWTGDGPNDENWSIDRRGAQATARTECKSLDGVGTLEVFLENTRRDAGGVWFVDRIVMMHGHKFE